MEKTLKLLTEKLEAQGQTIIRQKTTINELREYLKSLEKENRHLAYQTATYLNEMREMKSDETSNFKEDA